MTPEAVAAAVTPEPPSGTRPLLTCVQLLATVTITKTGATTRTQPGMALRVPRRLLSPVFGRDPPDVRNPTTRTSSHRHPILRRTDQSGRSRRSHGEWHWTWPLERCLLCLDTSVAEVLMADAIASSQTQSGSCHWNGQVRPRSMSGSSRKAGSRHKMRRGSGFQPSEGSTG